ncbi:MAG: MFS transporter [Methylobacteriaceae bacterium]|nr:MFS transporter [Methylobacteriaceae bacterium]
MDQERLSRRLIFFINVGHAFDHFLLLVYPTAVLAITAETGLPYSALIGLSTGAFVAFGLFSLPVGWLADRISRRNLFGIYFVGYGASALGIATAHSATAFTVWLLILGIFSAIYHPIGTAMLVAHARRLGHDLGVNAVWGNLGAAFASGVTAFLAAKIGWQAAFLVPGIICIAFGIAFLVLVPSEGEAHAAGKSTGEVTPVGRPVLLFAVYAVAIAAGGMTFNILTIAMPKVIDERLGAAVPLFMIGSIATGVFIFGALTQLVMGRLIDRFSLTTLFMLLTPFQPIGLLLAALTTGWPLLVGLAMALGASYGQVVLNDAMIARYVPGPSRVKAVSIRYFIGFAASGFAVPLIALLYGMHGFTFVLAIAAAFGALIVASAVGFAYVVALPATPRPVAAE